MVTIALQAVRELNIQDEALGMLACSYIHKAHAVKRERNGHKAFRQLSSSDRDMVNAANKVYLSVLSL